MESDNTQTQPLDAAPPKEGQRNLVIDFIMAIVLIAAAVLGGQYAYQQFTGSGAIGADNIVIFDTSAVIRSLGKGESQLSAKEVRQLLEREAKKLSDQGYIVIRGEMVWSAPDETYRKYE